MLQRTGVTSLVSSLVSKIVHVKLLEMSARRVEEKSMSSKSESISMVACVDEERVRFACRTASADTRLHAGLQTRRPDEGGQRRDRRSALHPDACSQR